MSLEKVKELYNQMQNAKNSLIKEINNVCKELVDKFGCLDDLDIDISYLCTSTHLSQIILTDNINTMILVTDSYGLSISDLEFEQLYYLLECLNELCDFNIKND